MAEACKSIICNWGIGADVNGIPPSTGYFSTAQAL
jgi:hypothetical protein